MDLNRYDNEITKSTSDGYNGADITDITDDPDDNDDNDDNKVTTFVNVKQHLSQRHRGADKKYKISNRDFG